MWLLIVFVIITLYKYLVSLISFLVSLGSLMDLRLFKTTCLTRLFRLELIVFKIGLQTILSTCTHVIHSVIDATCRMSWRVIVPVSWNWIRVLSWHQVYLFNTIIRLISCAIPGVWSAIAHKLAAFCAFTCRLLQFLVSIFVIRAFVAAHTVSKRSSILILLNRRSRNRLLSFSLLIFKLSLLKDLSDLSNLVLKLFLIILNLLNRALKYAHSVLQQSILPL